MKKGASRRTQVQSRGYFGIGIERSKTEANVGTLWRSAYCLGASFIFTIGKTDPGVLAAFLLIVGLCIALVLAVRWPVRRNP